MRSQFNQKCPSVKYYRKLKNINNDILNCDLRNNMEQETTFETFHKNLYNVLEKHAPLRKKILRANHQDHVDKSIRKEIM